MRKLTKENLKHIICTGLMIVLAVLFTIAVKRVDKAVVLGKEIGFSNVNIAVHSLFGVHDIFDKISDITIVISFLLLGGMVFIATYQFIMRKKLKAVDTELVVAGAVFVLTVLTYIFFENVIINFRPVLEKGALEASYPSTHIMLSLVINILAIDYIMAKVKSKKIMIPAVVSVGVLTIVGIVARMLSGMHWLTDIVGGLIIASALVMLYFTLKGIVLKKDAPKSEINVEDNLEESQEVK